ncbi:hypothetical protein [Branchiibius cervicis]|uniref:Aminoacyl-tRNA synthetase class I anticodon-binding domain-containing protein n=1 Tax=Branchiibius cervicis TaxID=908252 RepID=A0ABW2AVM1_9MICO
MQRFDWSKVNKAGSVFNLDKLNWLNGHYIRSLPPDELAQRLLPVLQDNGALPEPATIGQLALLKNITPLVQTRITTLKEAIPLIAPFYVANDAVPIADDARATLPDSAAEVLDAAIAALEPISGAFPKPDGTGREWLAPKIESSLREALIDGMGLKPKVAFGPLRVAVSGQKVSPPLFESMELLGKEPTLTRLRTLRASL